MQKGSSIDREMAATEFSRSPALNSGLNPMSKTQGVLVETMQLVEPRKSPLSVPNHILDSSKKMLSYADYACIINFI